MAEIVITEFMDESAVERLRSRQDTLYDPSLVDKPEELHAQVAGARALIVRNRTQVRGDLLGAAGRLSCVGRLGVGLDNIDVEACKARAIALVRTYSATERSFAPVAG
jgi:(S)-sulfolactate dehydrogenase